MNHKDAKNFLDWLWLRLKEEPGLEKALNDMLYIQRVKMEKEIKDRLED